MQHAWDGGAFGTQQLKVSGEHGSVPRSDGETAADALAVKVVALWVVVVMDEVVAESVSVIWNITIVVMHMGK